MSYKFFPRLSRPLAPALLAAAFVFAVGGESSARERCTTKPAVCARLKAAEHRASKTPVVSAAARPQPSFGERLATTTASPPRCTTKPAVCARLSARSTAPSLRPVTTLASSAEAPRCVSKPAVCARLKMRPSRAPITLADAAGP